MTTLFRRLKDPVPVHGFWCVAVPFDVAKAVLQNKTLRPAIARTFASARTGLAYLVLWVGTDPRWVVRRICRLMELTEPALVGSGRVRPPEVATVPASRPFGGARKSARQPEVLELRCPAVAW